MYRKAIDHLVKWKQDPHKKALLITGARQIGKTYLVRKFGTKYYDNFIEINFSTNPEARDIFKGALDAKTIYVGITTLLDKPLIPHKTLIFLDEIQECPNARTAIKFLVEDGLYDFIESGSLLGVNYTVVPSYPVGFEEKFILYPMDFEEFCLAYGVQDTTFEYLKDCFDNGKSVSSIVHNKMIDLFRYYIIVGGMPDAIKIFVETSDVSKVIKIQKNILDQYRQDISKYSLKDKLKINEIFDAIPSQLEEKNRRFKLASIGEHARLRDYQEAFVWLKDAGVALPCFNLSEPKVPLKLNEQARLFKLFLSDCGLLCAMAFENVQFAILKGELSVNMGSILENVFAQELISHDFNLRYLNKQKVGELDFVVQKGSHAIAIEIKSGSDYKKHHALDNALAVKEWNLQKGIVFCRGNLEVEDKVVYLPLYMSMFFKQESIDGLKVSKIEI